jgi:hypothetical protein
MDKDNNEAVPVVADNPAPAEKAAEAVPTEAEPKEQPKAEETQPKTVNIVDLNTGDGYDLSPQEVVDLAQYAIMENSKKKTKDDEPKADQTDSQKLEDLTNKIKNMETTARNEKQGQIILDKINTAASKFELTKDGGPLTEKIKMMALVKLNQNPRLDPAAVFAEETKSYMDIFKAQTTKKIANEKVQGAMDNSTLRGGAMPVVDTSREYKAADLKGQGSQEAMRLFLENS